MTSDFDAWWELRGCREEYGSQEAAARAAFKAGRKHEGSRLALEKAILVLEVIHGNGDNVGNRSITEDAIRIGKMTLG